jgi:hypothetical protein
MLAKSPSPGISRPAASSTGGGIPERHDDAVDYVAQHPDAAGLPHVMATASQMLREQLR